MPISDAVADDGKRAGLGWQPAFDRANEIPVVLGSAPTPPTNVWNVTLSPVLNALDR